MACAPSNALKLIVTPLITTLGKIETKSQKVTTMKAMSVIVQLPEGSPAEFLNKAMIFPV
jgi:hypothetical protein